MAGGCFKKVVNAMFPWYHRVTGEIKVRVKNFILAEDIRNLRHSESFVSYNTYLCLFTVSTISVHLNMLIKTIGVVTVTTGILPQLSILRFDCKQCSYVLGPFVQRQESGEEVKPSTCPACQSRGPFELNVEQVRLLRSMGLFNK